MLTFLSFSICFFMIVYLNYIKVFKFFISLILILSLISVFFINDVLFNYMFFPDQHEYLRYLQQWRSLDFENFRPFIDERKVLKISTLFYSFIPLPTPTNLYGFAFFNKFLLIILFFIIMKKNIVSGFTLLFIILYPSLHLYSSLTLRDTLVLFLMFLIVYSAFEKNFLTLIFLIICLYYIKRYNFYLLSSILISIYIFKFDFIKKHIVIFLITTGILFLYFFDKFFVELINVMHHNFYFIEIKHNDVQLNHLDGYFELIYGLISGAIYFYFAPIISLDFNIFELLQFFENIFLSIFLIYFIKHNFILDKYKTFYWILLILTCFAIYGLVVINPGSVARWRYPFIVIFIIGLSLDNKINKQKLNE